MNFITSEINSCKFLFLEEIHELDHNGLQLLLKEGIANPEETSMRIGNTEINNLHRVELTSVSRAFEITWSHYVAYSVRNESYVQFDDYVIAEGGRFQITARSHFKDYVDAATFAQSFPENVYHYTVHCENHIIDVASTEEPTIARR